MLCSSFVSGTRFACCRFERHTVDTNPARIWTLFALWFWTVHLKCRARTQICCPLNLVDTIKIVLESMDHWYVLSVCVFYFLFVLFLLFFPPHLVWECLLQKNKQVNAKMHKCDSSSIWLISDFSDLTGKNVCLWNGQCLAVWPVGWSKNPDSWIVWTL